VPCGRKFVIPAAGAEQEHAWPAHTFVSSRPRCCRGSRPACRAGDWRRRLGHRTAATPGLVVVNALIDPEAGTELKSNPDVRMIAFSDLVAGQAAAAMSTAGDGFTGGRPG